MIHRNIEEFVNLSLQNLNRSFCLTPTEEIPIYMSSTRAGVFAWASYSPESGSGYIPQTVASRDCLFLFGILLLSGLFYVNRLGFYADDWYVWSAFDGASDQSLCGLLRALPLSGSLLDGLGVRPAQTLYQALTYSSFGLHPLPYHLFNTVVLAGIAVLFYASLRELRLPHCITLVVPLVYGFLPHYATDRFWIAAHQAVLSQAFFFFGLYAALRAMRAGRELSFCLKAVSILSFAVALLFYEVILGLLPAAFLFIGNRMYTKSNCNVVKRRGLICPGCGYVLVAAISLGTILVYKSRFTNRVNFPFQHSSSPHLGNLVWNAVNMTIRFNVLHYGAGLPRVAFALYRFSGLDAWSAIAAGAIAITVLLYLNWTLKRSQSAFLSKNGALYLIAVGLVMFVLDYVPFFVLSSNFSYDGMSNRVTIASAIGAAFVLAGGAMLLIRATLPAKLQSLSVCGAVAAICALNYVCIASFANCWAKADIEQRDLVSEVRKNVNLLPGSTLLLDGFCRYVGPAPVFENASDLGGALRIAYQDHALQADVVSPTLEINDEGIRTTSYGVAERYVYGEKLWLYNGQRKSTLQLINSYVARNYFQTINPDKNSGCPVGIEGAGSPTS
jgi:hypothetical protein